MILAFKDNNDTRLNVSDLDLINSYYIEKKLFKKRLFKSNLYKFNLVLKIMDKLEEKEIILVYNNYRYALDDIQALDIDIDLKETGVYDE